MEVMEIAEVTEGGTTAAGAVSEEIRFSPGDFIPFFRFFGSDYLRYKSEKSRSRDFSDLYHFISFYSQSPANNQPIH